MRRPLSVERLGARFGDYVWATYDDLYRRVLSVGSALVRLGLARGEPIGLLCDNCPEWVVAEQA